MWSREFSFELRVIRQPTLQKFVALPECQGGAHFLITEEAGTAKHSFGRNFAPRRELIKKKN